MKNNNLRAVLIGAALLIVCIIVLCGGVYLISVLGTAHFNPKNWQGVDRSLSVFFMSAAFVLSIFATVVFIISSWSKDNEKTTN